MHVQRELLRDREDEISLGDATGEERERRRERLRLEQRRDREGVAANPLNGQAAASIPHEKDLLLRLVLAVRQGVAEKSVQQVPHLVILSSAWYAHACITLVRTLFLIWQPHLVILSTAWISQCISRWISQHMHHPHPNSDPNLAGTRSTCARSSLNGLCSGSGARDCVT